LGAVDHGYPVVVVRDALCSASDEGHDALLKLYARRFSVQIQTASTAEILAAWPR
jgi:nicotinamidase-related amidase